MASCCSRMMALSKEQGETSGNCSRWEEMPPDILAKIFHFLTLNDVLIASRVCRAWQSSACLELFLSTGSLNLRPLDCLQGSSKLQYAKILDIVLSLPASYSCWHIFIAPSVVVMPESVLVDFARRTPQLRVVILPMRSTLSLDTLMDMLCHWSKLEVFSALLHRTGAVTALRDLGTKCRKIRKLSLLTRIGMQEAAVIVENFQRLERLVISRCVVTIEALGLILDGCKRLKKLDITHSKCVDEMDVGKNVTPDILDKVTKLREFAYCSDPGSCSECWTESFLF